MKKCLAKDPDERWQSASDLASELQWMQMSGSQAVAAPVIRSGKQNERLVWIGSGVLLAVLAAYLGWQIGVGEHSVNPAHLTVSLPPGETLLSTSTEPVVISPDGSEIVYGARGEDQKVQLYVRKLSDFASTPIAGTEDGQNPFFSPNGEWLGFVSENKLKKVSLRGGSAVAITEGAAAIGG